MAKMFKNTRFNFVGEFKVGKEPVSIQKINDDGFQKLRMSAGVKVDQNMQFLNLEFLHGKDDKTTKILGTDFKPFEVDMKKTKDRDVFDKSADFIRTTIDIEKDFEKKDEYMKLFFKKRNHEMKKEDEQTDEDREKIKEYEAQINELADNRHMFCCTKDVIEFLNSNLSAFDKQVVRITGDVKSNCYKGSNSLQYIPKVIEIVPSDTPQQLKVFVDIVYEKDSIDDDKKAKKMFINGYIGEKVKKEDKLFPTSFVLDYTRVDEEDPQQKAILDFMKDTFKITNKKQVHKIGVEVDVVNGRETKEFSEEDLTEQQKVAIKLGFNKLEDFQPKNNVYGDQIRELKVVKPDLKNYPNGAEEIFPVKDLADYLVSDDSDVSAKDVKKAEEPKEEKEDKKENSNDAVFNALFGAK
ncbi:MAG: hypothetical protein ACRCVJ_11705 [Clostridium sp.]|uniref:hypothetical protein n=1 Tax=Clostridium sp. TaxID=1506 RepID=UPI003F2D942F